MVALSMVAATAPVAVADDGPTQSVHALENGEDLYLSFGADLGDMTLEEYVEEYADDNPSSDAAAEVIQYQDVNQVNIHEQGEAVSIAIGGGEATAIQEATQENTNVQVGEASAENVDIVDHETTFEDVGDTYLIIGNGTDNQFDGWGIVGEDGTTVTQTAAASVSQAQSVGQANVIQNTTAFAFAEDESTATAVQLTEQSNLNLQEGSANATNVYAGDLEGDEDKQKTDDDGQPISDQTADASVEQAQEVDQVNINEQGSAVAIAVGTNASATAVQITDQTNVNEQVGTAEAINLMMASAGMNVATAGVADGNDVVTQDTLEKDGPDDPKIDDDAVYGVDQTAEASVTQYQSVEQVNINVDSSAQAIATNGSEAEAVQLTFQQNINAQVASAEALNVFVEDASDYVDSKDDKKGDTYDDENEFEGAMLTETTTVAVDGGALADADRTSFDYDGDNEQLNDVTQFSTAEVEQSQNVTQVNLNTNTALAVADDGGSASALQLTMQENENVQLAASESTTVHEVSTDDEDEYEDEKEHDEDETKHDDETSDPKEASTDDNDEEKNDDTVVTPAGESADEATDDTQDDDDDGQPGFGIAVAIVALLTAGVLSLRKRA